MTTDRRLETADGRYLQPPDSSLQPAPSGGMHWSRPEGVAFLCWLMRAGGRASGQGYTPATGRMHVNNGASSARRLLAELGYARVGEGIDWRQTGDTEGGLTVGVYDLPGPLLQVCRRVLSDVDPAMRRMPRNRLAEIQHRLRVGLERVYAKRVQGRLFDGGRQRTGHGFTGITADRAGELLEEE